MCSLLISIISHHNDDLIVQNNSLCEIAAKYQVVIKSNTKASDALKAHCMKNNIVLIDVDHGLGFGANNNYVFNCYCKNSKIGEYNLFLVLNPDVIITCQAIDLLVERSKINDVSIATINLYRDINFTEFDYSIKRFPSLITPLFAKLTKKRKDIYDKAKITGPQKIDWAAGSFLLFKVEAYRNLNGFNEKYFMYFEDVDLARRASKKNIAIVYYPDIKAIHCSLYKNRNITSQHFLWYLRSFIRYYFM